MSKLISDGKTVASRGYGHAWKKVGDHEYRLFWTVDVMTPGSRVRDPSPRARNTDYAGALRFAKKWNLKLPPAPAGTVKSPGELLFDRRNEFGLTWGELKDDVREMLE
jgi:hypothetical protein